MNIRVSEQELRAGEMSEAKVEQAMEAILIEGYVILDDVVDHDHLDLLHGKMAEDSEILIRAEKWGGAGSLKGHLTQYPPPMAPYVFRDIVANPFVIQVTKRLLPTGPKAHLGKMFNSYYNANANCPGSLQQALHMDWPHLWPGLEQAHPPYSLAINICLGDVTEENGATEIWPGSHLNTKPIDDENVAAQRRIAPPIRAEAEKGSLVIRDNRIWHRGMTNHANEVRHMLHTVHNIYWRKRRHLPVRYLTGCEAEVGHPDLDPNATFADEPFDYLFQEWVGS